MTLDATFAGLGIRRRKREPPAEARGFSIHRPGGIEGRALLHTRTGGMELVKRLKDAEGTLPDEVRFWAEQLADIARVTMPGSFRPELVTHPPSSGKRAHHLAAELAARVARALSLPYQAAFRNLAPRGHRASLEAKLSEQGTYRYEGPTASVLVVDDAYCTGMTARRCVQAAEGARLWFLVLSRS